MNHKTILMAAAGILAASALSPAQAGDYRAQALAMMKRDFHTRGIAGADRLEQDAVQAICNRTSDKPPEALAKILQQDQMETIRWPSDGKYLGDWQKGEKIAQSGKGMTWKDKPGVPGGGGCYNCHQIGPQTTSFGTLGPTLYQFGKIRGYGIDNQKYVWGKIWNSKATNLCSNMPRFGHSGSLTEAQIRDLTALLLDPKSPVNSQ
ncbi:MAG: hypothetical protein Fur0039_21140 [Rhodocyclaceae bacterium]